MPLPAPSDARPIALAKLVGKLSRGQRIGTLSGGIFCIPQGPITWRLGMNEAIGGEQLNAIRDELKKAGYRVSGQSDSLFEDPAAEQPEILIGGVVKGLTVNTCSGVQGRRSESTLDIEWQVYDTRTRSVVLTLPATATATSKDANREAYVETYVDAVRTLLADEKFVAAVRPRERRPGAVEFPPIPVSVVTIRPPDLSRSAMVLRHAQSSVVTITIGRGHGSGVIVSPDGWVLTAAHVVAGASGALDVHLADGRKVAGTTLRSHQGADVALVQLPRATYPSVPIGASSSLQIGMPVYAIGTPLDQRYARSVTKGVVSALRLVEGRSVVQSDAVVHAGSSGGPLLDEHGRLVALTMRGLGLGGAIGVGLNEFLPIDDAWKSLQVEPQVSTVDVEALGK